MLYLWKNVWRNPNIKGDLNFLGLAPKYLTIEKNGVPHALVVVRETAERYGIEDFEPYCGDCRAVLLLDSDCYELLGQDVSEEQHHKFLEWSG